MAEAFQTTRWRTFDGREFVTEAEAEAHEKNNFSGLLVGLTAPQVTLALMRAPNDKASVAIANAIERAAYLIAQKRKDAGELWRKPKEKAVGSDGETQREPESEAA